MQASCRRTARVALANRKVTAINVATGTRYDATTGINGGYTIKVPEGTYRLEVELHEGEAIAKQPEQTHINNSDLDAGRDFVVTAKRPGGALAPCPWRAGIACRRRPQYRRRRLRS